MFASPRPCSDSAETYLKGNFFLVHDTEAYRGSGGTPPLILNLGTIWQWAVSFTSRKNSVTYWTGGSVGPRPRLHVSEKRLFFCPCRDSNPAPPAPVVATLAHISVTQWTAPPGTTSHSTEQYRLYTRVRTPDTVSNGDFLRGFVVDC